MFEDKLNQLLTKLLKDMEKLTIMILLLSIVVIVFLVVAKINSLKTELKQHLMMLDFNKQDKKDIINILTTVSKILTLIKKLQVSTNESARSTLNIVRYLRDENAINSKRFITFIEENDNLNENINNVINGMVDIGARLNEDIVSCRMILENMTASKKKSKKTAYNPNEVIDMTAHKLEL